MAREIEQRVSTRFPSNGYLRVRTAECPAGYKVFIKNISRSGAFVRTSIFPPLHSQVHCELFDQYGFSRMRLNGNVVRISQADIYGSIGFAIQFEEDLPFELPEDLLA